MKPDRRNFAATSLVGAMSLMPFGRAAARTRSAMRGA